MSYRPMVHVDREWAGNGLRFATHEEALRSASGLAGRWFLVDDFRADESSDPVNYAIIDGHLLAVTEEVMT